MIIYTITFSYDQYVNVEYLPLFNYNLDSERVSIYIYNPCVNKLCTKRESIDIYKALNNHLYLHRKCFRYYVYSFYVARVDSSKGPRAIAR